MPVNRSNPRAALHAFAAITLALFILPNVRAAEVYVEGEHFTAITPPVPAQTEIGRAHV